MKTYRMLKTALTALRRNVLRAALTMLGIVIGVAAVIAMMEIGNGSSLAIQRTIASMGANNLLVMPGTAATGGVTFGAGTIMTLTPEDADAILREAPAVGSVAPVVRARTQLIYGNQNWVPMYIYGTTPAFLAVRDWTDLAEGQAFTDRDVRSASTVCLLGRTVVRQLFGEASPIGKEIRVQNVNVKVIGVLQQKGANMMGIDQDDILLTPWTTIKFRVTGSNLTAVNQSSATASSTTTTALPSDLYPTTSAPVALYPTPSTTEQTDTPQPVRFINVDQIMVAARSAPQIPAAITQITGILRDRHRLRGDAPDDFQIRDMTEITRTLTSTTTLMTKLLLCVAMISLVVGGVGIMNIMLVSVTERTREIGLRMAVGAEPGDILRQFLTEAVTLCLVGGTVGILCGRGSSYLVTTLLHWPTAASFGAIVAAVLVSATVGIVFGFYPAWKASRLDPIEALRYE
jgi:ABC-type antimicrobial peptide transport system permease subunit